MDELRTMAEVQNLAFFANTQCLILRFSTTIAQKVRSTSMVCLELFHGPPLLSLNLLDLPRSVSQIPERIE